MMRAVVDEHGNAVIIDGQAVVVMTDEPEPAGPPPRSADPGYRAMNAFHRRVIITKRR